MMEQAIGEPQLLTQFNHYRLYSVNAAGLLDSQFPEQVLQSPVTKLNTELLGEPEKMNR